MYVYIHLFAFLFRTKLLGHIVDSLCHFFGLCLAHLYGVMEFIALVLVLHGQLRLPVHLHTQKTRFFSE